MHFLNLPLMKTISRDIWNYIILLATASNAILRQLALKLAVEIIVVKFSKEFKEHVDWKLLFIWTIK